MNQLLNSGEKVKMLPTELTYEVEAFLGGGGQGEVYRARLAEGRGAGARVALKWFFPTICVEIPTCAPGWSVRWK